MDKIYTTLLLVLFSCSTIAQNNQDNIFLSRNIWKKNPSIETVKNLIAEGNDPAELSSSAFDAVCYAILENTELETIQYLLSLEGNEVDKVTHDGRSYLMWAAYKGNADLMTYLIKKGSNVKLVDDHGYNLITFASISQQKNLKVFDLILANGGSMSDTTRDGATALLLNASHMKSEATWNYFIEKGAAINAADHDGNNLFTYAARLGNKFVMNKAIQNEIDYLKPNNKNGNAMLFAAKGWRRTTNTIETFLYLDSLGIKANVTDSDGNTPLHALAKYQKNENVWDFFIGKGLLINKQNESGNTALLYAINAKNKMATQLLLPLTDTVNHKNKEGESALIFAFRRLNTDLAEQLLNKNANAAVKDSDNRNLIVHLFYMLNNNSTETFESLLALAQENGVSETEPFEGGKNLVHLAIEKNSPYLLNKAIELEQNINGKNKEGLTPLHVAAMKCKDNELLKLLLSHGADKTILTDFEESAYDLALENELIKKTASDIEFLKLN